MNKAGGFDWLWKRGEITLKWEERRNNESKGFCFVCLFLLPGKIKCTA